MEFLRGIVLSVDDGWGMTDPRVGWYRVPFYRNAFFLRMHFGFMNTGSHKDKIFRYDSISIIFSVRHTCWKKSSLYIGHVPQYYFIYLSISKHLSISLTILYNRLCLSKCSLLTCLWGAISYPMISKHLYDSKDKRSHPLVLLDSLARWSVTNGQMDGQS